MYSNDINCKPYIDDVKEWDTNSKAGRFIFMMWNKRDLVQVANAIRNEGYTVIAEPILDVYEVTVFRKVN